MTLRIQVVLSVVLAVSAGFLVYCHFYPLLQVSGYRVLVDGAGVATGDEDLFANTPEKNFFRQPLRDFSRALLARHPDFSAVNCHMNIRGEVVCEGVRKKPLAIVCVPEAYGLSAMGELLPLSSCGDVSHLPLVTGVRIEDVEPYKAVTSEDLHEALRLCKLLYSTYDCIGNAISEIDFGSGNSPVLHFRDSDIRVIVGRGSYRQKLSALDMLLDRLEGLPAGELDLRFGRSVVARDLT
jgi:hypothetical protein